MKGRCLRRTLATHSFRLTRSRSAALSGYAQIRTASDWCAISSRLGLCYAGGMDMNDRNALRAAAGLPRLDDQAEAARLQAVREEAEFEVEWEKRKPEFASWIGNGDGWLSKMGR